MLAEELAVDLSYDKAMGFLSKFLRVRPSTRALQEAIAVDSQDLEAFYEQAPAPTPDEQSTINGEQAVIENGQATILAVEADGKGVAMVRPLAEPMSAKADACRCSGPGKGGADAGREDQRSHRRQRFDASALPAYS